MNEIWLTSDWHLFHNKDFIYKTRGFDSVADMNESILERHNLLVEPNDTVYVLGDALVGGRPNVEQMDFLKRFNGNKILVFGNHDTDNKLQWYQDYNVFQGIEGSVRIRFKKIEFILSHYPTLVANQDDPKPVWNIHGHTHNVNAFSDVFHTYNVNMEAHDCYPVNIAEIYEEIRAI